MKRLISVPITFFLMASTASAQVSQFVFITEPQTVSIGVSSETITIQSQNSQGVSENITETHDLVFTSISPTGQFFNTSGNPVSTTMSKNTANKNFLYQDSTVGTYTLTITATGRTSLQSFSASQQITIGGESSSSSNSTTTNEQTSTETTTDQSSSSQTNTANSAHSSPAPLSSTENKIEFEVSAGRDRLTAVGNPVIFIASPTKLQNLSEQAITYKWSFGDGTTLLGKTVTHNYRHAGNYAIVLNAYGSDKQAVSRINVKVILPLISLQRVSDGIEIENKSGSEINLGGWSLANNNKSFIIPEDTLVSTGTRVVFADETTGINSADITLSNPIKKIITTTLPEINLGEIQAKINEVKVALNNISPALQGDNTKIASVQKVEVVTKQLEQEEQEKSEILEKDSNQLANVIEVFEAPERQGFLSSIFSFVKRLFVGK
ncbi:MAG: hypothetical protein A3H52_00345 [Candidatus Zambryskibacteria bacterium RIFCSPLOWO2_02_FULL_39_26]|uniref:PKD domain-containing protein n=1 Tax=Candidatus Zambryskibacteria bacterium RIFCSPLOWO2_12_FULL_39_23 TaxID=1802776 RepID=A0A1G2US04_9BACT|nr:MAG: hypothetical protein A3H52_00345 [Candidatus Zambryskibacteria bacterium RIFCSPLOWO2_02_FULL_39_26]OHB12173.1 MAG: hypothetical protein A3G99_00875 [Candidatus Zambryskibacteria bacterium RIFCSPLOWO2_12_FULL_39_23]